MQQKQQSHAAINNRVIVSDASQFASTGLNPLSETSISVDLAAAKNEHHTIRDAMERAKIAVRQVPAPPASPDGVYAANWGLCIGDTVVYSKLPDQRTSEEPYVRQLFATDPELAARFTRQIEPPHLFSGQGDTLVCGDYLFCGQGYRTDPRMHGFLAGLFPEKEIISLQTVPVLNPNGSVFVNSITGLADSYFYDLDLALSILSPDTFAWCPKAFTPESQAVLRQLTGFTKIEVDYNEAVRHFACNLISSGTSVVMSNKAPKLRASIEAAGFTTITPEINELSKGGGFIRCVSLTVSP